MPKSRKWKILTTAITLSGLTLSVGAGYGIYKLIVDNNEQEEDVSRVPMQDYQHSNLGFNIEYYSYGKNSPNNVLDSSHIKKVYDAINSFKFYGPEARVIKRIAINDPRLIGGLENGVYIPSTLEIGLTTDNFEKNIEQVYEWLSHHISGFTYPNIYDNSQNNPNDKIKSKFAGFAQDIIVEHLLETYYHEYGHHLFLSYPSNPLPSENNYTSNIYSNNSQNRVNKEFANEFVNIFSYSSDQKNISDHDTSTYNSHNGKTIYPIGSKYSLKELYDMANIDQSDTPLPSNVYFGWKEHGKDHIWPQRSFLYIDKVSKLKYFYSVEELYTRRFLLSTYPANDETISIINGLAMVNKNIRDYSPTSKWMQYLIAADEARLLTALTRGMLKYDDPRVTSVPITLNYKYDHRNYFADDPFYGGDNTKAKDFSTLVAKSTGLKQGYNLSYIAHENTYKRTYFTNRIEYTGSGTDLNKVVLGGYMPKNKTYKYLGYKDDAGKINEISTISTNDVDIAYKDGLLYDKNHTTQINTTNVAWVTDNYVWARNFDNKPLYFYNDESDYKALTTYRGQKVDSKTPTSDEKIAGHASSWSESDPYSENGFNVWIADKDSNNKVVVKMGGFQSYG